MSENTGSTDLGKSSTGIQPNVAAVLAYVMGFITGIIFFVMEKENKFVKFHAMQSIMCFVGLFVSSIFLSFLPLLGLLLNLASLVLWILCMVQAYQGRWFRLPVIGDLAAKQVGL